MRCRTQPSILIVEDDAALRVALVRVIRNRGWCTYAAGSAEEALELVDSARLEIDAIISDFTLPGISGLELIRQLRAHRPSLPAVLVTGASGVQILRRSSDQVQTEVIRKPLRYADLLAWIEAAIPTNDQ
jgi:CheY-like chemotaxis protein